MPRPVRRFGELLQRLSDDHFDRSSDNALAPRRNGQRLMSLGIEEHGHCAPTIQIAPRLAKLELTFLLQPPGPANSNRNEVARRVVRRAHRCRRGRFQRPRKAASSFAMSNLIWFIISFAARAAADLSGSLNIFTSTVGTICQRPPYFSMIQPHACGLPPLSWIPFQ